MKHEKFSIKSRLKSFVYAINGLKVLLKEEHNSRIHLIAAIGAIVLSLVLQISTFEWLAVVLAIGFVFAMELMNSAVENMADMITKKQNETISKIKDLAAAGVLVSAVTAFIIGLIIFTPKIIAEL